MIKLTYLLTPWGRALLEKLTGSKLVKKYPECYETRRFFTAFTRARHLSLSWANSIQSIPPHPTSWRSVLILSSHLCLGLPSGLFPSGFPTKTLYTPLLSPIRATCHAHLIIFDYITRTIVGEEYRSLSFSLCSFLHSPVTSFVLKSKFSHQHSILKHCWLQVCSKTLMKMGALWNLREKAGKRKCWERLEYYWRCWMLAFTNISSINSADTKCISGRENGLHIDLWMRRFLHIIKLFKTATALWLFAALLHL